MGRLIYAISCSLDGYVNDASGDFGFSEPDVALHDHFTELERTVGTHLYGRRMLETMAVWEAWRDATDLEPQYRDFAEAWVDSDTIVYSTTLDHIGISRARLERTFDADAVQALKEAATRDLAVGGPTLAAHALRAGLVDEIQLAIVPSVLGGGTRALPDGLRLDLDLREHREFPGGAVLVRYAARPGR